MSDQRNNEAQETHEIITGGQTMVDDKGRLVSSVGKMEVTKEVLDTILGDKKLQQLKDPNASYRTTTELTEALIDERKTTSLGGPGDSTVNANMMQDDDRPFIGVNLEGKLKPKNLPEQGKDPMGMRKFIGDEFPRMLAYGPPKIDSGFVTDPETGERRMANVITEEAKPAFYSHWPEGTELKDMKTLKISIATKLPDYMAKGEIAASLDARKEFSFKGQSLEEAFTEITDKVEKAWRRFAKDYEKTYGIKLDVRRDDSDSPHDEKDVNMTVCGFQDGNPQLAGFANFPEALSKWGGGLESLGHKQGYMMLNQNYCNSELVNEDMIYDLVFHEFGHFMGMVHPHDLGGMKMTQQEALNNTAMAYTDGKFSRFEDKDGNVQEGAVCGPVDLGLRNYMHEPPQLNTDHGAEYDMEAQYKRCLGENADSQVMALTHMMPTIPILSNGTGTILKGSANDDVIDTERGHVSFRKNHLGIKQGYALVEGHIEKVLGHAGNNDIFLSSKGSQEVHPGPGRNRVHIYAPNIGDNKVIHSQGNDVLMLHQDLFLANPGMKAEQDGKDIILKGENGSITLKNQLERGQGVSSVAVLNDEGRAVMQQDVRHFTAKGFNSDLIQQMKNHARRMAAAEKEEAQLRKQGLLPDKEIDLTQELPGNMHEHCDHGVPAKNDNTPEKPSATDSHLERLRLERDEKAAKGQDASRG